MTDIIITYSLVKLRYPILHTPNPLMVFHQTIIIQKIKTSLIIKFFLFIRYITIPNQNAMFQSSPSIHHCIKFPI